MATLTDSQLGALAALEKQARRAHWIDRNKNVLMLAAIACFTLAGLVVGLGVGHWMGAQQERAERSAEIARMQDLLSQAITKLGTIAPKVEQAAATVAQTADQVSDRMDGAASRLDEAASKADAVAAKATSAAAKATVAAARAGTAAATAREAAEPIAAPAPAVTRAVREANQRMKDARP